jgi:hypothetical protein
MGRMRRVAAVLVAVVTVLAVGGASASAAGRNPFQVNLGVGFYGSGAGTCTVQAPATLKRCTLPSPDRRAERADEYPATTGHIVSLSLRLAKPTEGTTAVEVRFRARPGPLGGGSHVGPWESLDLEGPRLQEFPLSVRFDPGDQLAIDLIVHGDGSGEATSPIESMSATFEREDQVAPRLHYSYAPYQDFLRTGRVHVKVRSDSEAKLFPECSLLSGPAQWGLLFNDRILSPGRWINFACKVYSRPLAVARKKVRRGGHPLVMVHLIAYDVAGNKTAEPKIYIRPL